MTITLPNGRIFTDNQCRRGEVRVQLTGDEPSAPMDAPHARSYLADLGYMPAEVQS